MIATGVCIGIPFESNSSIHGPVIEPVIPGDMQWAEWNNDILILNFKVLLNVSSFQGHMSNIHFYWNGVRLNIVSVESGIDEYSINLTVFTKDIVIDPMDILSITLVGEFLKANSDLISDCQNFPVMNYA